MNITLLSVFDPRTNDYEVSSAEKLLTDDAKCVVAREKFDEYFTDTDAIAAILVYQTKNKDEVLAFEQVIFVVESVSNKGVFGVIEVVPLWNFPPPALESFISENSEINGSNQKVGV